MDIDRRPGAPGPGRENDVTTTPIRHGRRAAVAAAALVLTLAACTSGPADAPGSDASPVDDAVGPLSQMFMDAYGELDEDTMSQQQVRMEQLVAECMAEQGWEYTPVDYSQIDGGTVAVPGDGEPEWGTEEFAQKSGYGITTWQSTEATAEPVPEGDADEWQDPNHEYVDSLSETARAEYYEALHGPQPSFADMESGEWEYDPADAGCYGKASEEVFNAGGEGLENIFEDPKFEALLEDINALYDQAQADPRLAELRADWTACMAEAGYPGLAGTDDAQDGIMTEHEALWQNGEPDASALEELQEKERAIAVADFRCAKSSDVDALTLKVQHELEQDFIDAHRAELDELLAAVRTMAANAG